MDSHKRKSQNSGAGPAKDIGPVLKGWTYDSESISVRKILGLDGTPKLQMRLDLGLLQMELTGRPDGKRPHNCESLLEYFDKRLQDHQRRHGNGEGFHLNARQCQLLRDEAAMYYRRYLSLFVLEEFEGVIRDTERNLRVLDLCGQYAQDEHDRLILEQYRPYILMMNARARASLHLKAGRQLRALNAVRRGIRNIREFFARFGQEQAYKHCNEAKVLRGMAREIKAQMPVDPVVRLKKDLERAIADERYEEAAKLRDELAKIGRA